MDSNGNRMEEVLAYLNGEMEGETLRQFQEQLASDDALQSEVEACRMVVNEFRKQKYRAFLEEVERFDEGLPPASSGDLDNRRHK